MQDYFFPALFLAPDFDGTSVDIGACSLSKRAWETSTFDLATLATKHNLHLPYQVMDVFLARCNLEICVRQQASLEDATGRLNALKLGLYGVGVSPFITPFATTYSINDYSGINSRDSDHLRHQLPIDMQKGLTTAEGLVEAWPLDLSFQCILLGDRLRISAKEFSDACHSGEAWTEVVKRHKSLLGFSQAILATVSMGSLSQSILHMWCALESLFPSVTTELSFRVSLYLSQLVAKGAARRGYFEKVREAYNLRSKIAHGSKNTASIEEWTHNWRILMDTLNAILEKGVLPSDDALLADVLS